MPPFACRGCRCCPPGRTPSNAWWRPCRPTDRAERAKSMISGVFGGSGHPSGGRPSTEEGSVPAGAPFGRGGAAVRVLPHGKGRTVAVIGVGYVGLPTAATLAYLGHRVTCGDTDPAKVGMLAEGRVPIVEDHLEDLVREG